MVDSSADRRRGRLVALGLAGLLFACGGEVAPTPEAGATASPVTPSSGSLAGYGRLMVALPAERSPESVTWVQVGPHKGIDLEVHDGGVSVLDQGSPIPGPVDVTVHYGAGAQDTFEGAFTYEASQVPGLRTAMAIGASLGQGVQRGVPSHHGLLVSPPAQLARALGLYMPLPLLVEGLLTQFSVADVGPPPRCETPDILGFLSDSAAAMMEKLIDPETDELDFRLGLVDPELTPHHVCVGNSKVADVLHGPGDFSTQMLSHLVYQPDGDLFDPIAHSQLELVEQVGPDLVVSVDLLGNDLILPIVAGDILDASSVRPVEEAAVDIEAIVDRLAAVSGLVLLGDLPPPSLLPIATVKRLDAVAEARRAALESEGDPDRAAADTDATYRAAIAHVDAVTEAYNQALRDAAAEYDHVLVVSLTEQVAGLVAEGLQIGDQQLHIGQFGGLLGLDGVHFTDTGYAMIAEAFIDAINLHFDLELPPMDLTALHAADVESPKALAEAGLPLQDCDVP